MLFCSLAPELADLLISRVTSSRKAPIVPSFRIEVLPNLDAAKGLVRLARIKRWISAVACACSTTFLSGPFDISAEQGAAIVSPGCLLLGVRRPKPAARLFPTTGSSVRFR